jgi:hypothetical protein
LELVEEGRGWTCYCEAPDKRKQTAQILPKDSQSSSLLKMDHSSSLEQPAICTTTRARATLPCDALYFLSDLSAPGTRVRGDRGMRSILSLPDRRTTIPASTSWYLPLMSAQASHCSRRIHCALPHACMQLRRLDLTRSSTGGAAVRFHNSIMFCTCMQLPSIMHAYGPWQPYPHDTCGPLVALTVLA